MKTIITLIATILISITRADAQTQFTVDTKTSIINWTGHAEVGSYAPAGTLNLASGSISLRDGKITSAALKIDMKSMQQSNTNLLNHLKSEDFFDVERFPFSELVINKVVNGVAYGQLTVKGKAAPFSCPVTVTQSEKQLTISGNTVIDRTKYGIIYNSGSFFSGLGDKAIRNTFDVSFTIRSKSL